MPADDAPPARNTSPKRRRTTRDESPAPGQSAPQVGSVGSILTLTEGTTFSAPRTPKRASSPIRELTQLCTARPPILQDALAMPTHALSPHVNTRLQALRKRTRQHNMEGYIPRCLKDALGGELAFATALQAEPIDDEAYDDGVDSTREDIADIVERVKAVFQGTELCQKGGKDENGWCLDVVGPLLELAMVLYGHGRFRREIVQSQSIQPAYLSLVLNHSSDPPRERPLFRKTDFCFSYSHLSPQYATLYERLRNTLVAHTTDNFTQRAALFSGVEVKPAGGSLAEAQLQLSIWMAASLRKKAELFRNTFGHESCLDTPAPDPAPAIDEGVDVASTRASTSSPHCPQRDALIEPAVTIIGAEHKLYYALVSGLSDPADPKGCTVSVLGPDRNLAGLSTESISGIFRLARVYGNIFQYGFDEDPKHGYWGAFLGPLLEEVARASNGG